MEPKKTKRRVRPAMDSVARRPRAKAPAATAPEKAPTSSHVIDLRQQAAAPPERRPESPKPAPRLSLKKSPKPAKVEEAPVEEPVEVLEPALPATASTEFSDMPMLPRRRFWPAFWRFLVLLVILGLIVAIGIYLYLNYYHT